MKLVFLCISYIAAIVISSGCSSTYNTVVGSATLPRQDSRIAVGYDEDINTILAIGGTINPNQFFKFKVNEHVFEDVNRSYFDLQIIFKGSAPYTAQIGDVLWTIGEMGSHFLTFNLQTEKSNFVDNPWPENNYWYDSCLASHQHYLFIVGGFDKTAVDVILVYNSELNEWIQNIPTLNTARYTATCIVADDGTLFTIGGIDSAEQRLDTIETLYVGNITTISSEVSYDVMATLSTPLYGSRAVQYESDIIVIGGYSGTKYVAELNVINIETKTVQVCGSLQIAAMYMAPIIVDNTLYIFGGFNRLYDDAHGELAEYQYIELPAVLRGANDKEGESDSDVARGIAFMLSCVVIIIMGLILYFVYLKREKLFAQSSNQMDKNLLEDGIETRVKQETNV